MATEALVQQVRRKLNITWDDNDTNSRVSDIISSAEAAMTFKLGIAADAAYDFAEPGIENILFLSYCLYLYNHVENEFDDNYIGLLGQAQAKWEVKANATAESEVPAAE